MGLILAFVLTLAFAYVAMHYTLSTFWDHPIGVTALAAVFAVLTAIFVSVFQIAPLA